MKQGLDRFYDRSIESAKADIAAHRIQAPSPADDIGDFWIMDLNQFMNWLVCDQTIKGSYFDIIWY